MKNMKNLLKKYNIKAKKSLWQNFLVNDEILEKIASFFDLKDKNIIEVWPWFWALTEKILEKNPKNLVLVELDLDMINILNDRIKNNDLKIKNTNFKIENIDVLKYEVNFQNYYVIANIPYYITSPILTHFLYKQKNIPEKMLILMQKDVADKIEIWQKNEKKQKSSVLSLLVAKKAYAKQIIFVWRNNFIPAPKVESSVVFFEKHNLYDDLDDEKFLDIIKKWFLSPRKKLVNNLSNFWFEKEKISQILEKIWLNKNVRPEDLNIEKWVEFIKFL